MVHTYSHLFELPATGLQFFTVYGPWGRPDMAYYRFAEQILVAEPVALHADRTVPRDLTYIDDITGTVVRFARYSTSTSETLGLTGPAALHISDGQLNMRLHAPSTPRRTRLTALGTDLTVNAHRTLQPLSHRWQEPCAPDVNRSTQPRQTAFEPPRSRFSDNLLGSMNPRSLPPSFQIKAQSASLL